MWRPNQRNRAGTKRYHAAAVGVDVPFPTARYFVGTIGCDDAAGIGVDVPGIRAGRAEVNVLKIHGSIFNNVDIVGIRAGQLESVQQDMRRIARENALRRRADMTVCWRCRVAAQRDDAVRRRAAAKRRGINFNGFRIGAVAHLNGNVESGLVYFMQNGINGFADVPIRTAIGIGQPVIRVVSVCANVVGSRRRKNIPRHF